MLEFLSEMNFDNYICISQQKIADDLKMQRPHVARAIKGLKEKNILVEGPRIGTNKTYKFNPYIGHKGKNRSETILDFEAALTEKGKNFLDADVTKD